jgi:hypothetical protein
MLLQEAIRGVSGAGSVWLRGRRLMADYPSPRERRLPFR